MPKWHMKLSRQFCAEAEDADVVRARRVSRPGAQSIRHPGWAGRARDRSVTAVLPALHGSTVATFFRAVARSADVLPSIEG